MKKAKRITILEPAVDDFCYLLARTAIALLNPQSKPGDTEPQPPSPAPNENSENPAT